MNINEPMKNAGRGVSIIDGKAREFQAFLPFEEEKAEENTVHENTVHRAMEKVGDLIHTEKMIRAGYCLDGL